MALSFAKDIRPMFRQGDIDCMKDYDLDLNDLGNVRMRSADIYRELSNKGMPDDGPWPDADIAKFKQWMDEGMLE